MGTIWFLFTNVNKQTDIDHSDLNQDRLHQAGGQTSDFTWTGKALGGLAHTARREGPADAGKYHSWHPLDHQTPRLLRLRPALSISIKEQLSPF